MVRTLKDALADVKAVSGHDLHSMVSHSKVPRKALQTIQTGGLEGVTLPMLVKLGRAYDRYPVILYRASDSGSISWGPDVALGSAAYVSATIRSYILLRDLSTAELAKASRIDRSYVHYLFSAGRAAGRAGVRSAPLTALQAVSEQLGLVPDYLAEAASLEPHVASLVARLSQGAEAFGAELPVEALRRAVARGLEVGELAQGLDAFLNCLQARGG